MPMKLKERDELEALRRPFLAEIVRRTKVRAEGDEGDADDPDQDDDTYDVSLSSEYVVDRWYGREILDHSPESIDMSRAQQGLNLLFNHDPDQPIGRLENLRAEDSKLKATMRFYSTPAAQNVRTMVDEGMREMSLGYQPRDYEYTEGEDGAADTYRWTRWTPMEGSIVSVPADPTIGVGRAAEGPKFPVFCRSITRKGTPEVTAMPAPTEAAPAAAPNVAAEIARLAARHGMSDKVAEWLEGGATLDKVRELILDARSSMPVRTSAPELDLTAKERKSYSYARAILAAADMAEGRKVENCFELELARDLERSMPNTYKAKGGLFVPTRFSRSEDTEARQLPAITPEMRQAILDAVAGKRALDSKTTNALKEVVFTEQGAGIIELLRNLALVIQMGARVLTGLSSPVAFVRQTGDVTAYWVAENPGADVTDSNPTTDLVFLTPKTLQASVPYSRQLLVQASIDVEAMVRESIAIAHALGLDLAALYGTGTNNQPVGIYNQTGVNTVAFGSANPDYAHILSMESAVANANAYLGALGWLTRPSVASKMKGTLEFAVNGARKLWEGTILEGEVDGYTARATNQISATQTGLARTGGTESGLVFGNWNDLLIGQFGGAMELIVDPYRLKKQGLIEVTSFQMADVAVRHGASFCVATGMVIS